MRFDNYAAGAPLQGSQSPRAAAASPVAQGSVGVRQGGVAALAAYFSRMSVEPPQNSTEGPVGTLGAERLEVFQKDPKIVKVVALIEKVQQAIGEPIEGEPEYSSLFEKTAIQTANDCIETLKELKQWVIQNRLLHGKESYTTHARELVESGINPLRVIKSNLSYSILKILKDKKIQQIAHINHQCNDAIVENNYINLQDILYDHIQDDIPTLIKLCRNLKHCGLVEEINKALETLESA